MGRVGLTVTPQALWDQFVYLQGHVQPTYDAIYDAAFDEDVLYADEAGWPMLQKGRKTWQVWCLACPRLSYFRGFAGRKTPKTGWTSGPIRRGPFHRHARWRFAGRGREAAHRAGRRPQLTGIVPRGGPRHRARPSSDWARLISAS